MQKGPAATATGPHVISTPTGSRTPVSWLRTRYPRPLDDGGVSGRNYINRGGQVKGMGKKMGGSGRSRPTVRLKG